jgi:tRNA(Arg) A34 adenosine deaminase TadA
LGSARLGAARLGAARRGSARLGAARLGAARRGAARRGSARRGLTARPTGHTVGRIGTDRKLRPLMSPADVDIPTGPRPQRLAAAQEQLLGQAIAIASDARAHGNHPFGALLADAAGRVLLTAENTVVTDSDATGHAETNLVRRATAAYSAAQLAETTLYTSTEPCAMCAGAIYWSGIGAVVYALAETALHELTGDDPDNPTLTLPCRTVLAAGQRVISVAGPFDLSQAREVHIGFWRPSSDPIGT